MRIGSNCVLVSPVKIGNKVTTGAGSTITRNVEDGKLALARSRQTIIDGWARPEKNKQ
ncbi:UDP-N-acetylglucosamine pyrophosphorylase [Neisseria meningitidis]|nr:UDP-N-acetylglucosamine pyrophosphorylase [Neisseria meningitidis]